MLFHISYKSWIHDTRFFFCLLDSRHFYANICTCNDAILSRFILFQPLKIWTDFLFCLIHLLQLLCTIIEHWNYMPCYSLSFLLYEYSENNVTFILLKLTKFLISNIWSKIPIRLLSLFPPFLVNIISVFTHYCNMLKYAENWMAPRVFILFVLLDIERVWIKDIEVR